MCICVVPLCSLLSESPSSTSADKAHMVWGVMDISSKVDIKIIHKALRKCYWCKHIGARFNWPIFVPKSGCFSGMSLVGRASAEGLMHLAEFPCFVQLLYLPIYPFQSLVDHGIPPLSLSSLSYLAMETKVCIGMGSSWDAASMCSQVWALKQRRVPQFVQTLACEVSWGLLSHLEHLAHAGPCTTTLRSVVPKPDRWHPSQLCHPRCCTLAVYLSQSSVQGVLWQIHFVLVWKQCLCLQRLWCTCVFPLNFASSIFSFSYFANKNGKMK